MLIRNYQKVLLASLCDYLAGLFGWRTFDVSVFMFLAG